MFRANTPSRPNRIPGTMELEISDPVLMLNEIARRYETTERVLMEYVDNALDDAEALYRENDQHYPYPIAIEITIDPTAGTVTIQDNCRGMPRDVLERVVKNIGESSKRGVTWVNGRFGFGVHAFRAAAESIRFQTQHQTSSGYSLELDRSQHRGIKEAKRNDDAFPSDSGTGTIVTISNFDADWNDFSVDSVKAEIEHHFERLIARPNLTITVGETDQSPQRCLPFDYETLNGESIRRTLQVDYKEEPYPIAMQLMVARDKQPDRAVSFFVRGRRINDAVQIKSFMRKSNFKTRLWGHPHLLGYIEVGEIVQPAITRDDFNRTKGRQLCYEAILALEPEINTLIRRVNTVDKDKTLGTFENAINDAVAAAGTPDQATIPALGAASEGSAATAAPSTDQIPDDSEPFAMPDIRLVSEFPTADDADKRVCRVNKTIYINIEHPDFQERLAYTRQKIPKITDRLTAYLAGLISIYYPVQPSVETADLKAQVDTIIKLETALHQQQSELAKALVSK
ncbi:MAG: sensor histidine kinase [Anaerolineae bacterium]|nr:sensor histidine kinase [Anaerolineae bacterium]